MRKKARLLLTFLSITAAFTLFGTSIGFDASIKHLADLAREDRITVYSRFGIPMPLAMVNQIARLPDAKIVALQAGVAGYFREPRNNTFVLMVDPNFVKVFSELPVTDAQLRQLDIYPGGAIYSKHMADQWRLKVGDRFPVKVSGLRRADGSQVWTFQVLAIVPDFLNEFPQGFAIGSFKYYDNSLAKADQGHVGIFHVVADSPSRGEALARRIDQTFANSGVPTISETEKFATSNISTSSGIDFDFLTRSVAGAGLFMILFLTGNAVAQSVRERIAEFAALKAIGFSDLSVMALVFAEALLPCLLGAAVGMAIAHFFVNIIPQLLPPGRSIPMPYLTLTVHFLAFSSAAIVAAISAVLPALRLKRLDVATALSGRT